MGAVQFRQIVLSVDGNWWMDFFFPAGELAFSTAPRCVYFVALSNVSPGTMTTTTNMRVPPAGPARGTFFYYFILVATAHSTCDMYSSRMITLGLRIALFLGHVVSISKWERNVDVTHRVSGRILPWRHAATYD